MKSKKNIRKQKRDEELLPIIEETVKIRPSYGYRRVMVLLNKALKTQGKSRVNHKCVYRVMKQNHLLLPSYDKKPTRNHDGKVITLRSNTRWCTDTFAVQCFNGDRLHVAFAMDT